MHKLDDFFLMTEANPTFIAISFRGVCAGVGDENAESCRVVRPLRIW